MSTNNNQPEYEVFVIRESKEGKSFWTKIGAGFRNKDGSVNIDLTAFPVGGRCQLRERKEKSDRDDRRGGDNGRDRNQRRDRDSEQDRFHRNAA